MRSTKKEVIEKIQAHILEYYEEQGLEGLKHDIDAVKYGGMGDYQAIKSLVDGGAFEVYHVDVQNFLNGLGINEEKKEYDTVESWELYKHLIAREALKLLK